MTYRQEIDSLKQQLRRCRERNSEEFDRGFEAAVRMMEAGATPERMRLAIGIPCALTSRDTEPVRAVDPDADEWGGDTLVDFPPQVLA